MFTTQALLQKLAPCADAPALWLGLSGGLDSMVLLHALAQLRLQHPLPPVTALHIHHGLNPQADHWAEQCAAVCKALDLPLRIERVQLQAGASIENAAREVRYAAFERAIGPGEVLLLAHHRDDQVETLMFRLLRGTGLHGLTGMPRRRRLAAGELMRPLLDWTRADLAEWAVSQGLGWVDDPANSDPRFARTALRHDLLPRLRSGWPMVDASLLRLAEHADEALDLLDERAVEDWHCVRSLFDDPWLTLWPALNVERLLALRVPRQVNLLRYWLRSQGCQMPDQGRLHAVIEQLHARPDGLPEIKLDGHLLIRSVGHLWLVPGQLPRGGIQSVRTPGTTELGGALGYLSIHAAPGGLAPLNTEWTIRYRQGGERIKLVGRPTQTLKQLFQEAAIPVWLRDRVPLVYVGERLVSVAGRWNAEDACVGREQSGWHISWQPELPNERR